MEVTYRMQNGYQVPNLLMPQAPEVHLGKYAELRREYLKKHRRALFPGGSPQPHSSLHRGSAVHRPRP